MGLLCKNMRVVKFENMLFMLELIEIKNGV